MPLSAASAGTYRVNAVLADDDSTIRSLAVCQASLAGHHHRLYEQHYPDVTCDDWASSLACGRLKYYIEQGVRVFVATEVSSGEVAGYVSLSRMAWPAAPREDGQIDEEAPTRTLFTKINHILVMEEHRGRGVGTALFEKIFQCLPHEDLHDLRIVAAELNTSAVEWYYRLGFRTVGLQLKRCKKGSTICFVTMRRCMGVEVETGKNFFGRELVGEQVQLLPEQGFDRACSSSSDPKVSGPSLVTAYDEQLKLHRLKGEAWIDLSPVFAQGRLRFARPLHHILASGGMSAAPPSPPSSAEGPGSPGGSPNRRVLRLRIRKTQSAAARKKPRRRRPASEDSEDDDECLVCGEHGEMIICDGREGNCNATYHPECAGLTGIPTGDWFCPSCSAPCDVVSAEAAPADAASEPTPFAPAAPPAPTPADAKTLSPRTPGSGQPARVRAAPAAAQTPAAAEAAAPVPSPRTRRLRIRAKAAVLKRPASAAGGQAEDDGPATPPGRKRLKII